MEVIDCGDGCAHLCGLGVFVMIETDKIQGNEVERGMRESLRALPS